MLTESPVIVLKAVDFKESSKIITFFSREHGRMAVLMRGIKRKKNKYAGLMGYGSVLNLGYYYKNTRSVQTFKDAETRFSTARLNADFNRMALCMAFLELVSQIIQEGEPNDELFAFSEKVLHWVNGTEAGVRNLFPYLQLRIAEIMGVGLQQVPESVLDPGTISSNRIYVNVSEGMISDHPGEEHVIVLSEAQKNYVSLASCGKSAQIPLLELTSKELKQLINHLDTYLKYHIDGVRDRKSDAIFEQIL